MSAEVIPLTNSNGKNDRFTYAKIRQGEQWQFLKKAAVAELEPNLQREVLWADFVNYVSQHEPNAHIRSPRIIGFDDDGGLLMEYIDAPQVADPSDGKAWKANIDRYAGMLSYLDKYALNYMVHWPSNEMATIDNIDRTWNRWFGENYESSLPILEKAHAIIVNDEAPLTYCVQHGDLTPWQMFEQGGEWIIYDGEKAGNHLPRYNDLAYGYGRLFTRLKDSETAAQLLEKFIAYSNVERDEFFRQFLPVMTFRATGMLADAYNDRERENYIEQANDLLALCFMGELNNFLPKDQ